MTNFEADTAMPSYMREYYQAFQPVPFTAEASDGTVTDATTGQAVELRATDAEYRSRYGTYSAQQAVRASVTAAGGKR